MMEDLAPAAATQKVYEAILALNWGVPAQRGTAGIWLNQVVEEVEIAPQITLELMQASYPTEVQFFSVNMLLALVKRRWFRIPPEVKEQIHQKLMQELDRWKANPAQPGQTVLPQRAVMVLAAASAHSGLEAINQALWQAISIANQGNVLIAAEILAALAEAVEALHRHQRPAAVEALGSQAHQVFPVVRHLLEASTGPSKLQLSAVRCLDAWLHLDATSSGEPLLSPGAFRKSQKDLFRLLLRHVKHEDEDVAAAATDAIIFLMSASANEDPEEEEAAVRDTAAVLVQSWTEMQESALHNAAQIATSLASRNKQAIADRLPEAVPLAMMVLKALACGHQGAAESAMEYFAELSDVPPEQRQENLGEPIFKLILMELLKLASYPADFGGPGDDFEDFHRFREYFVSDALIDCQQTLHLSYLDHCSNAVTRADSWQAEEAALFALRLYKRKSGTQYYSPGTMTEEDVYLLGLIASLCSPSHCLKHMLCVNAFLQFLRDHATWVASTPEAVLSAVIAFIISALRNSSSSHDAALVFKFLCDGCLEGAAPQILAAVLHPLCQILEFIGEGAVAWKDKEELMKGVIALIRSVGVGSEDAVALVLQVVRPVVHMADAVCQESLTDRVVTVASGCLDLLATAVEHVRLLSWAGTLPQQPPAQAVASTAMECLERIVTGGVLNRLPDVSAGVCRVLTPSLRVLMPQGEAALVVAVTLLGHVYRLNPEACYQTLAAAADLSDSEQSQLLLGSTVKQMSLALLSQKAVKRDEDELGAWFTMLVHCLANDATNLRQHLVLALAEILHRSVMFAVSLLRRQDEVLLRPVISFLRIALGVDAVGYTDAALASMQTQGEHIVTRVMVSLAWYCPQRLLRALSNVLHGLLHHVIYGPWVQGHVRTCLSKDPHLCKWLSIEVRSKLCQLMLGMPKGSAGSFAVLMRDMAGIARSEIMPDVLLAYEL